MNTETTQREAPRSPQLSAQLASFRRDPPLHQSCFPKRLSNGATVPGINVNCPHCKSVVDPAMVRGRLIDSLPTVVTLDANAYCEPCQRFFHFDGRYRVVGDSFQFEYPDERGRWHVARKPADTSLRRALADKLGGVLGLGR